MTLIFLILAGAAKSGCEIDISEYVGWEIIYAGQITGYIDESGDIVNRFRGCKRGRILIVDKDKTVTCNEYSYSYAYRPEIAVISNGYDRKACIDDEIYDLK
ncbi:MAG: hypothetical protein OXC02_03035 [Rhodobacteraceae bacterium]|nr:hypothetical protein [Paracoccaceae bacterium]